MRRLYTSVGVVNLCPQEVETQIADIWCFYRPKQQIKLFRAIRDTRLSWIITTFFIQLELCIAPDLDGPLIGRIFNQCTCYKLEAALGMALGAMVNLSRLRISCRNYHGNPTKTRRHSYLSKIVSSSLVDLRISCTCTVPVEQTFLLDPRLDSVHTLQWCGLGFDIPPITDNVLLKVEKLPKAKRQLLDRLLPIRRITHIDTYEWSITYHDLLKASKFCGSLQQLFLGRDVGWFLFVL